MKRQLLRFLPALALLGVLAIPTVSEAQFRLSVGSGGYGRGGAGWGNNFGPGIGYGRGAGWGNNFGPGGFGLGSGYGRGWGNTWGGQGLSLNLGNRSGFGYGYPGGYGYSSPSYGYATPSYGYAAPSYGYAAPSYSYSTPVYSGQVYAGGSTGANYQQSFYPPSQGVQTDSSRAYIRVNVPADAEVLFNGTETNQRGTMRMFQSPPLDANNNYSYEITARWMENGQERKQTRTVQLQPGSTVDVSFTGQQGGQSGDLNNRTEPNFDQPNRPNQQPLNQPNQPNRPNNNLNQPNQPNINQPNQPNINRPNQPNNVNQPNRPGTPPRPQQQQDLTAPDR